MTSKTIPMRVMSICVLTLLLSFNLQATEPWPQRSTNISFSLTSLFGFHTTPLQVDYMWHKDKVHHGISGGFIGVYWDSFAWAKFGPMVSYNLMTGRGNNHFELILGAGFMPFKLYGIDNSQDGNSGSSLPIAQLGYRYQKPDGRMFFRVNAGITGLILGTGIRLSGK